MKLNRHTIEERSGRRTFLRLYDSDERTLAAASFERYWLNGATHTGVSVKLQEGDPQVFVGLHRVACGWLTVETRWLSRWLWDRHKITDQDVLDLRVHSGAVWWSLWHPSHEWHSGTPRWRNGNWHPVDSLLGKQKHAKEIVDGPVRIGVPMPERIYPAEVTIERATWKRPRWPWPKVLYRYDLKLLAEDGAPGYIPEPGKGENSWDCGPDGTFGICGPGRTPEQAVGALVASVLRTRKRRGVAPDYAEPILT